MKFCKKGQHELVKPKIIISHLKAKDNKHVLLNFDRQFQV